MKLVERESEFYKITKMDIAKNYYKKKTKKTKTNHLMTNSTKFNS
jgi:hypothetical protein